MSESQLIKTSEKFLCDTVYIEMVLERYGTSRHSDGGGKTLSATSFGENNQRTVVEQVRWSAVDDIRVQSDEYCGVT